MACNILRELGKIPRPVYNGFLYTLRMCSKEVNSGQPAAAASGIQSHEATYGAPEYFQYNQYSFNDIHVDTEKYRLPRPSSKSRKENK